VAQVRRETEHSRNTQSVHLEPLNANSNFYVPNFNQMLFVQNKNSDGFESNVETALAVATTTEVTTSTTRAVQSTTKTATAITTPTTTTTKPTTTTTKVTTSAELLTDPRLITTSRSAKETASDLNLKQEVTMNYDIQNMEFQNFKESTTTKQGTTETQELQPETQESEQVNESHKSNKPNVL
jgi:hypothetical protein